jgi:hypothetical protein
VFDFVETYLPPGEQKADNHHYGVQVFNPTPEVAHVRIQIGAASVDLRLAPEGLVTVDDERSQDIRVENLSGSALSVIWKKSRD